MIEQPNPYAAPIATSKQAEREVYVARLEFWRVFLVAVALTVVICIPILYAASLWNLVAWRILLPAFIIAFTSQAVLIRLQKITVSADVLRCADFWGHYHTIETDSIHSVSPVGFGVFRFLKLHNSTTATPLWLPLFLANMDRFWAFVGKHVNEVSALNTEARRRTGDYGGVQAGADAMSNREAPAPQRPS